MFFSDSYYLCSVIGECGDCTPMLPSQQQAQQVEYI